MRGGIQILSIYDPVTGIKVQIEQLDAASTTLTSENIVNETTGSRVFGGKSKVLTVGFFDISPLAYNLSTAAAAGSAITQLEAWQAAQTPLRVFGYGGFAVHWNQPALITCHWAIENKTDARQGRVGYVLSFEFHGNTDLIKSVANLHTLATPTAETAILYPLSGVSLTGSLTSAGASVTAFRTLDYAGDAIQTEAVASGAGRQSVDFITDTDTVSIDYKHTSGTITFISISTDGVDTYREY